MIKNFKWLLLVFLTFAACNSDIEDNEVVEVPIVAGSADFSTYVALGNSLTAGYSDGALFKASQDNAFPKLMAEQFALAGGGEFKTPFVNDNIGGLLLGGNVIAAPRLIFLNGAPTVLPNAMPTTEIAVPLAGPFNNMGVPGAKSYHLLAPNYGDAAGVMSGTANPYFVRFRSSASTSVIADAMAQNPTFFSLWIGNNDVLGYALSGGDGTNPITPEALFTQAYNGLVTTLTSNGAKGIVANIPDVKTIPHFKVVPFNPLDSANPAFGPQIATLNATLAPLNQAFAFLGVPERSIVFNENGKSPVVIHDETLPNLAAQLSAVLQGGGVPAPTAMLLANQFGQSRQATAQDLFVLPASSIIGKPNAQYYAALVSQGVPAATAGQLSVNGVTYPLQDKWVLLPSEQMELQTATTLFNGIIKSAADQAGLAFVDVNAIMTQLSNGGVRFDNYNMTAAFVQGGAFSLDGVHLTARANAYIANQFMKSINTTYGSTLRMYKPGDFPISYPAFLQ
ncbi:SGNH/GDSL hydrolase family protein [Flavobacterium antarcticum]|uniref:SGNH/GDSL hydrolase family protein n=1 Tax=Flavobacterium antarcticum TaxID=271155 RepID=UPI0003B6D81E|nr:SGNH/GDSL hydrolase family protein [Flavobacterium antarcticum]